MGKDLVQLRESTTQWSGYTAGNQEVLKDFACTSVIGNGHCGFSSIASILKYTYPSHEEFQSKSLTDVMWMLRQWTQEEALEELDHIEYSLGNQQLMYDAMKAIAMDFALMSQRSAVSWSTTLREMIRRMGKDADVWANEWLFRCLERVLYRKGFHILFAIIKGTEVVERNVFYLARDVPEQHRLYPIAEAHTTVALLYHSNGNHYEPVALRLSQGEFRFALSRKEVEHKLGSILRRVV